MWHRSRSDLQRQVAELVEQQAAISEVLRAIAHSPHDLQPIFDTILINATRLCRAPFGALLLFEEKGFRIVTRKGPPNPAYAERVPLGRVQPIREGDAVALVLESGAPVHIADLSIHPAYLRGDPLYVALVELAGVRTHLLVPLRKDDELIGALGINRGQVQPFTDRQIDLVTDFAAQTTIALESTRRERQYREVQVALAHANRIATIGQLTASITHELSQPLAAMTVDGGAALRWLANQPPNIDETRSNVARMIKQAQRATHIIVGLRDLAKQNAPRAEVVDLSEAIAEVIALTHSEALKTGVTVSTRLAPQLPRVQGDRVQLQQVMLNLIVNAIQAMSGIEECAHELQISIDAVPSEGGVRVGVRDTGPGLNPESLSRLFEPFYTTKSEGMGMGLSISRSIIEAHGGQLWATPCEPRGALFQFSIPAT
jgi:signal transduction histidine kinase